METTALVKLNETFKSDLIQLDQDINNNFLVFEKKTITLLGSEPSSEKKENALKGIASIKKYLKETSEKRLEKTRLLDELKSHFINKEKLLDDLINRLQTFANKCLELERKEIAEANEKIKAEADKKIDEIKNSSIDDDVKSEIIDQYELKKEVSIIDDAKTKVKLEIEVTSKESFMALIMFYLVTSDFMDKSIDDMKKIDYSKITTWYKKVYKNIPVNGVIVHEIQQAK
jgi:hypothetical protein